MDIAPGEYDRRWPQWPAAAGLAILALAWLGPLPALAAASFTAHMSMHVSVVAIAAPLLAIGLARSRFDPLQHSPSWLLLLSGPIVATVLELLVVWSWHSPTLHHLARNHPGALVFEQGMFLLVSLLVWLSAVGGPLPLRRRRAAAGIAALLLTSMHMTLLGALLTLSPRPLYPHHETALWGMTALQDQQAGGVLMLLGAGGAYLLGGLLLLRRVLTDRVDGAGAL